MRWTLLIASLLAACTGGKDEPAVEVCNGEDDNGDGLIDEGFLDYDEDGIADCVDPACDVDLPLAAEVEVSAACLEERRSADDPWDVDPTWYVEGSTSGVIVMPAVGLFTDADVPDIAWVDYGTGELYVERGDNSGEGFTLSGYLTTGGSSFGDVDGDGEVELIAMTDAYAIAAIDASGTVEWTSDPSSTTFYYPQSTIADLDGDGTAEVIFEMLVVSGADGTVLFELAEPTSPWRTPVVADIDQDGTMEIILAENVYDHEGNLEWAVTASTYGMFSLVVDADDDDEAEVLFVGDYNVGLYEDDGTEIWSQTLAGSNAGPPCAADFDGDGEIELGVPEATVFEVLELDGTVVWQSTISDSSGLAGCSAWDINEDGAAELLYADQDNFYIYDGADGSLLYNDDQHTSGTVWEYPVPADLDGDGAGEVVVASNGTRYGVYIYEHATDEWPSASLAWPVHDWCGTNQYEDGSIPDEQDACWLSSGTFRAQVVGGGSGSGNADLTVGLTGVCAASCSDAVVVIGYQVANNGVEDVEAGVSVALYTVVGGERILITTDTLDAIPAGSALDAQTFQVAPSNFGSEGFVIRVDDDGSGRGGLRECDEDNNEAAWEDWVCDPTRAR